MKAAIAFACGCLFATGLGISGMLQPAKVIGFLDFAGEWDPTLLGVMLGAIPVYLVAWLARRGKPSRYGSPVPARASHALDARLVLGASVFGVGWGLAGVCPGPALANLAAPSAFTLTVAAAITAGIALSALVRPRKRRDGERGLAPSTTR